MRELRPNSTLNRFVFSDNLKLDHGKIALFTLHIHTYTHLRLLYDKDFEIYHVFFQIFLKFEGRRKESYDLNSSFRNIYIYIIYHKFFSNISEI